MVLLTDDLKSFINYTQLIFERKIHDKHYYLSNIFIKITTKNDIHFQNKLILSNCHH